MCYRFRSANSERKYYRRLSLLSGGAGWCNCALRVDDRAARDQLGLRQLPAQQPAIHPRNRDDEARSKRGDNHAPEIAQASPVEHDRAASTLDIAAQPSGRRRVNPGPADDGDYRDQEKDRPAEEGPDRAREAEAERL